MPNEQHQVFIVGAAGITVAAMLFLPHRSI